MPMSSSLVGRSSKRFRAVAGARWLMSYAAGLPDITLHGTATLALAVSALVRRELDGDPARVHRYGCRFAAMVRMPSTIALHVHAARDRTVWFTVLNEEGDAAIDRGYLIAR